MSTVFIVNQFTTQHLYSHIYMPYFSAFRMFTDVTRSRNLSGDSNP
jgi:hypothetical protein